MSSIKTLILSMLVLFCCVANSEGFEENDIESRGKKKKSIALFVYFADLVIKKFFIVKLIYAFVFWVILHKAGYFLGWFASYLKEQKSHEHHHEFHPPHYEYHDDHEHSYGPYRRKHQGIY